MKTQFDILFSFSYIRSKKLITLTLIHEKSFFICAVDTNIWQIQILHTHLYISNEFGLTHINHSWIQSQIEILLRKLIKLKEFNTKGLQWSN